MANRENINPDSSELIANAVKKSMPHTPNQLVVAQSRNSAGVIGNPKKTIVYESMTPCKYHVATPPMPLSTNSELKTLLSTKI